MHITNESPVRIKLKDGILRYGRIEVPNNKIELVILTSVYRNVFYSKGYTTENFVGPDCFSYSEADEGMVPHKSILEPQSETCGNCPNNLWGSNPYGEHGKACKQARRLVVIPASVLETGAGAVSAANLAIIDLPVTSVKYYSQYVRDLAESSDAKPHLVVTEALYSKDEKTHFKVNFDLIRVVESKHLQDAILARVDDAKKFGLKPLFNRY